MLPAAPRRTPAHLRHDVERALIDLDPSGAERRAHRARRARCIYRPRPLSDGMASLTAVLPATTAVEVYATLDHAAHHARRSGDPRTLDQLRADHLHHRVTISPDPTLPTTSASSPALSDAAGSASLPPGPTYEPPGPAVAPNSTSRRPRQGDIRVHVALSTLLGLDDRPAEIAGYGPVDAAQARSLAVGGTW